MHGEAASPFHQSRHPDAVPWVMAMAVCMFREMIPDNFLNADVYDVANRLPCGVVVALRPNCSGDVFQIEVAEIRASTGRLLLNVPCYDRNGPLETRWSRLL